jgi:hypothetical protein
MAPQDIRFPVNISFAFRGARRAVAARTRVREVGGGVVYDPQAPVGGNTPGGRIVHGGRYTIPIMSNVENGRSYLVDIMLRLDDDSWTPWSNAVQFLALRRPVLDIITPTINAEVHQPDVTFRATFRQEQNERISTFNWALFDAGQNLIQQFPNQRPINTRSHEDDYELLSQDITGLENNTDYWVECAVETINGIIWNHRERFTTFLLRPCTDGITQADPVRDQGFINLSARLEQIKGTDATAGGTTNHDFVPMSGPEEARIGGPTDDSPITFSRVGFGKTTNWKMQFRGSFTTHGANFLTLRTLGRDIELPSLLEDGHVRPKVFSVNNNWIVDMHRNPDGGFLTERPKFEGDEDINVPVELRFYFYRVVREGEVMTQVICKRDRTNGVGATYASNIISTGPLQRWVLNVINQGSRMSLRLITGSTGPINQGAINTAIATNGNVSTFNNNVINNSWNNGIDGRRRSMTGTLTHASWQTLLGINEIPQVAIVANRFINTDNGWWDVWPSDGVQFNALRIPIINAQLAPSGATFLKEDDADYSAHEEIAEEFNDSDATDWLTPKDEDTEEKEAWY